ncbi:DUF1554 domain-containing protein [Leptospira barantonii]|uniref:DUF1554 domain-containing protein n=1 Tax=Leptospira barantonii TaxID=2023184 RepID=A0A5F2BEA6_9LEPT|nr:DUF1554 domain-containing protein [Leptospira barantonii]TGM03822.1 DUF1554 domain-containing protein [Leptospira barantonii]
MSNSLRSNLRLQKRFRFIPKTIQGKNSLSFAVASLGLILINCAQAKPIEFDSSHSQVGLLLNALMLRSPAYTENSPFFSVGEGQAITIEIPISSRSNLNKVKIFKESNIVDTLSFSEEANVLGSSDNAKVNVQLSTNTDLNCDDEDLTLNLKDENGLVVAKANVRILDSDKCMFFATANGAGYDGNLGGLDGADRICQNEKSEFLPGDKTEYRALLGAQYQRKPSLNDDGGMDWPILKNLRFYIHSNDSSRSQYFFGTSFSVPVNSEGSSGIFSIPLSENLPASVSPSPDRLWSGYYNSFIVGVSCSNWTSNLSSDSALAMNVAFNDTYNNCNVRNSVLCVRL